MKGVKHKADRGMRGAPHRLPGIAVIVDVTAPRQCFETDPHAAAARALAERMKISRGTVDAAEALRRDVGADEQQIAAELRHEIELAFGAREVALASLRRHALEIAERLKRDDLKPEIGDHRADFGRRTVERQQIVLEDFDALEAGIGNRRELLGEIAAERH